MEILTRRLNGLKIRSRKYCVNSSGYKKNFPLFKEVTEFICVAGVKLWSDLGTNLLYVLTISLLESVCFGHIGSDCQNGL